VIEAEEGNAVTVSLWPGGEAAESPQLRLPQEDWALPRAHPRYASVLRRLGQDGRFELLGLAREGGQALLWAARDHADGERLVVVKAPDPTSKDATVGPRLGREARLLVLVEGSRNVMPLLAAGPGRQYGGSHGEFESELPWLALPYRSHVLLPDAVAAAGGALTVDQAWMLGRGLAAGLAHLHARGVVHRDLSPGNVLLTPGGVVVADLGMAWAASLADEDVETRFTTGVTSRGGRGVTWGWLAPEAARWSSAGERPDRDPSADVFCWGLHVFVALLGRHPWSARQLTPDDREQDWMYQGKPPDLRGLGDVAVPEQFRDAVRDALAEDPARRPGADELRARLGDRPPTEAVTNARLESLTREVARITALERAAVGVPGAVEAGGGHMGTVGVDAGTDGDVGAVRSEPAGAAAAGGRADGDPPTPAHGVAASRNRRRWGTARRAVTAPLAVMTVLALVSGALVLRDAVRDRAAAERVAWAAVVLLDAEDALTQLENEYRLTTVVPDAEVTAELRRAREETDAGLDSFRWLLGEAPDRTWSSDTRALLDRIGSGDVTAVRGRMEADLLGPARDGAALTRLRAAYGPALGAFRAAVAGVALDLAPREDEPPVVTSGPFLAALLRARGALLDHRTAGEAVIRGTASAEETRRASEAWPEYRAQVAAARAAVTDVAERELVVALENEARAFTSWQAELTRPAAERRAESAAARAARAEDFREFGDNAHRGLAEVTSEVVAGARMVTPEKTHAATRRLQAIAAVALLAVVLVTAPWWLPRLSAARRRWKARRA
jgi:hypothetical protein